MDSKNNEIELKNEFLTKQIELLIKEKIKLEAELYALKNKDKKEVLKYYVSWQEYEEYNQFEGVYQYDFKTFNSLCECNKFIESMKENQNGDFRKITGPLIKLTVNK